MKFKFGLKNLRRLKDVSPLEIRPLTLLVGKNSSGKSSFLRTFPLLRQSTIIRSSAPVLWYGALVDFGNFETAVSDNDIQRDIVFSYVLSDVSDRSQRDNFYPSSFDEDVESQSLLPFTAGEVCVDVGVTGDSLSTRISRIDIKIDDLNLTGSIIVDRGTRVRSLIVDKFDVSTMLKETIDVVVTSALLPNFYIIREVSKIRRRYPLLSVLQDQAHSEIDRLMKVSLHGRVNDTNRSAYASVLLRMPALDEKNIQKAKTRVGGHSFATYCDQLVGPYPTLEMVEILRLHRLIRFFRLYYAAAEQISEIFRGVVYIGPARSRSERYYRYQELAVSEIDPDGTNFPMFLNSLTPTQIEGFSAWVKNLFGFGVKISRKEGHLSINVEYASTYMNIVDTGYGVSQILPVLGQIWWTVFGAARRPGERDAILTIEQPELHLHPAHQSLLADALTSVLEVEQRRKTSFIIETHSESLINRLGSLIYQGKLDKDKVSILIFEDDPDAAGTIYAKVARFEDGGILANWPYGFFGAEAK
jgi:hypothetical protein